MSVMHAANGPALSEHAKVFFCETMVQIQCCLVLPAVVLPLWSINVDA